MNGRIVRAVFLVTFREFWRSPEALFWTYGFPLLMAVVLGLAFQPGALPPVPVAVVVGDGGAAAAEPLRAALAASDRLQVRVLDAAAADAALARGAVAIEVAGDLQAPQLRADPTRADAELARLLVERALQQRRDGPAASPAPAFTAETRVGARYIDFLIPGLIGLNLLGAGLWGVGFNLVQMRTQNLLRRLLVTPMRRGDFLLGYLAGRFVLALPEAAAILAFGMLAFGVPLRGSVLAVLLLVVVGGLAFSGLGVLIASRARTIEGVGGLMNLAVLPMWLLGGSFFANERFPGVLGWCADALPLTWVNRALRDVMLEPGGLGAVWLPLLALLAFGAATFALALRIFRWT